MNAPLPRSQNGRGSHLKRVRARRRKRGVALVEAAACMPLFVVLWFSILYAHNLFATKMGVNAAARAQAWGFAMGNCGMSGSPNPTATPGLSGKPKYANMAMPP